MAGPLSALSALSAISYHGAAGGTGGGAVPGSPVLSIDSYSATFDTVTISWTEPSGSPTGYNVYIDGVELFSNVPGPVLEEITLPAAPGTIDIYVTALNGSGEGSPSNTVTTEPFPPLGYIKYYKAGTGVQVEPDIQAEYDDPVQVWVNQYISGTNMEEATLANQPTYLENQLDGYPGIYFDGVSQKLSAGSGTNDPVTLVIIGKFLTIAAGANQRIAGYGQTDSIYDNGSGWGYYYADGGPTLALGGDGVGVYNYLILRKELGVDHTFHMNGTAGATMRPFAGPSADLGLGWNGDGGGGGEYGHCVVIEVIEYPYIVDATTITALNTYITTKFPSLA